MNNPLNSFCSIYRIDLQSPCVRDYLKHVEELDRTYGNMLNGDGANASIDNSKKDEIINELPKTVTPEKDVGDGSGMVEKSGLHQEKLLSSSSAIFSSTINLRNVSKPSVDISTTGSGTFLFFYKISTSKGKNVIYIFVELSFAVFYLKSENSYGIFLK